MKKIAKIASVILYVFPYIILRLITLKNENLIPPVHVMIITAIIISILSIYYALSEKDNYKKLALQNMILKIVYIPIYIIIFIFGLAINTAIVIPGIGLILAAMTNLLAFTIDLGMLITTSCFGLSAIKIAIKKRIIKPKEIILLTIFHFIFVLDVIASIILYIKLRRIKEEQIVSNWILFFK